MKKYLVLCAVCSGLYLPLYGQNTLATDTTKAVVVTRLPAEPFMKVQVAHVSDFIRRFNDQATAEGEDIDSRTRTIYQRKAQIEALFDGLSTHENLKKYRSLFIESVLDTATIPLLRFPPKGLLAQFNLFVSLEGQAPQPILCSMRLAEVNKGYAWQWVEVEANFLHKLPSGLLTSTKAIDSTAFIAPNAHETSFLDVFNLVKNGRDLRYSTVNPQELSPRMLYLTQLMAQGKLTAAYTEPPRLFLGIGKAWMAALGYQNRDTDNSGWLIENLYLLPKDNQLLPAFVIGRYRE